MLLLLLLAIVFVGIADQSLLIMSHDLVAACLALHRRRRETLAGRDICLGTAHLLQIALGGAYFIAVLVQHLQGVRQFGRPIWGQLLLLETPSAAQKASIVEHVQAARLERPVGACVRVELRNGRVRLVCVSHT